MADFKDIFFFLLFLLEREVTGYSETVKYDSRCEINFYVSTNLDTVPSFI